MKAFLIRILQFLRIIKTPAPKVIVRVPTDVTGLDEIKVPKVILGAIRAYNPEVENIKAGVEILNKVLASETFKQYVLNGQFTETQGLSNAAIYQTFCSAPVKVDVNVYLGDFRANHLYKTVGYEDEPGVVNINRFFVSTPIEFADNIIHEAVGHSMGFSHYAEKSTSVPYQLNVIFEKCVKEMNLG